MMLYETRSLLECLANDGPATPRELVLHNRRAHRTVAEAREALNRLVQKGYAVVQLREHAGPRRPTWEWAISRKGRRKLQEPERD